MQIVENGCVLTSSRKYVEKVLCERIKSINKEWMLGNEEVFALKELLMNKVC